MTATTKSTRRNRLVFVVIGLILIVLGIYMYAARLAYDSMSLTGVPHAVMTPVVPFEDVSFPSRGRSYPVYAFWQTTTPDAPAIINVHGYKGTRYLDSNQNRANILVSLGYNVLTPDLSDNGGKTVEDGRISMGFDERYDVLGAYDFLIAKGFKPERIGLIGESMGAASIILAAALEPRVKAAWADSPFSDALVVLAEQAGTIGYPGVIVNGGLVWAQVVSGDYINDASALRSGTALAANKQAVYLVTCTTDTMVDSHHSRDLFAEFKAKQVDVQLWEVGCIRHVGAHEFTPDDYNKRMDDFFKAKLAP